MILLCALFVCLFVFFVQSCWDEMIRGYLYRVLIVGIRICVFFYTGTRVNVLVLKFFSLALFTFSHGASRRLVVSEGRVCR